MTFNSFPIGDPPPGYGYGTGWPTQWDYQPRTYPSYGPAAQGWQCPVCGTVYAPTIPSCMKGHIVTQVTTSAQPLPVTHEMRSSFGDEYCSCGRSWPCEYGEAHSEVAGKPVEDGDTV